MNQLCASPGNPLPHPVAAAPTKFAASQATPKHDIPRKRPSEPPVAEMMAAASISLTVVGRNDNNSSYCHSAWQFSRIKKNYTKVKFDGIHTCTVLVLRMAHRKRKETKQQPSMLPGPAVSGSCLVSLHILWAILSMSTV